MKIHSGKGDFGETSNLGGLDFSKNDAVIHFLGTLDELNSHLGLVKALLADESASNFVEKIQMNLVKIMSYVSFLPKSNEKYLITDDDIFVLENEIDCCSERFEEIKDFILPGKTVTEAQIQIARTVSRRAERLFFAVNESNKHNLLLCQKIGVYLNRLSDYLFVLGV
ncbi:MAG: cob(I)yrinic acid a,c-diamide adenosyltransferase [Treponema sp.]|nr:cob(I)yrinic acid a,c-diamide adenosyltransferase [Treponema sp.]